MSDSTIDTFWLSDISVTMVILFVSVTMVTGNLYNITCSLFTNNILFTMIIWQSDSLVNASWLPWLLGIFIISPALFLSIIAILLIWLSDSLVNTSWLPWLFDLYDILVTMVTVILSILVCQYLGYHCNLATSHSLINTIWLSAIPVTMVILSLHHGYHGYWLITDLVVMVIWFITWLFVRWLSL